MRRYCTTGVRVLSRVAPTVCGVLILVLTPDTAAVGLLLLVIIINGALVLQTRMFKRFLGDIRAIIGAIRADIRADIGAALTRRWSSRRALSEPAARELARLRDAGKTWRELAEAFGVSEKTAKRTYNELTGITRKR